MAPSLSVLACLLVSAVAISHPQNSQPMKGTVDRMTERSMKMTATHSKRTNNILPKRLLHAVNDVFNPALEDLRDDVLRFRNDAGLDLNKIDDRTQEQEQLTPAEMKKSAAELAQVMEKTSRRSQDFKEALGDVNDNMFNQFAQIGFQTILETEFDNRPRERGRILMYNVVDHFEEATNALKDAGEPTTPLNETDAALTRAMRELKAINEETAKDTDPLKLSDFINKVVFLMDEHVMESQLETNEQRKIAMALRKIPRVVGDMEELVLLGIDNYARHVVALIAKQHGPFPAEELQNSN